MRPAQHMSAHTHSIINLSSPLAAGSLSTKSCLLFASKYGAYYEGAYAECTDRRFEADNKHLGECPLSAFPDRLDFIPSCAENWQDESRIPRLTVRWLPF